MPSLVRRSFLKGAVTTAALAPIRGRAADTDADAALNAWLEKRFQVWLARSPMRQGQLGLKTNLDRWDDISEHQAAEDMVLARQDLSELRNTFKPEMLSAEGRLSYRLYEYESNQRIEDYQWRFHSYPINQEFGWQQEIPTFLINIHSVSNRVEAEAYVARLANVGKLLDQIVQRMRLSEAAGVLAPRFVYVNALRDCRNVITGAPFDASGKDSPIYADIKAKIAALQVDNSIKQKLRRDAESALTKVVGPGFKKLIAFGEGQLARAGTDDGAWHLPDGEAYYAYCLKSQTTTDLTADQIHEFGLSEVERIRGDMEQIKDKVKFQSDLRAFFNFMKTDPQFYFPQSEDGKKAYLARVHEIVDGMRPRLDDLFRRKPKADLIVKVVEPFREQSATSAFYEEPGAFDGRPGMYYVNTYDMHAQPKYEIESTTYHEAIPGHHMQIALTQEMTDLPKFRRFNDDYTAYVEGWALYCELLPKEIGLYKDPYSDFGRLSNELWRACRLVVDTALHSGKWKWSREKAIAYLRDTTPNSETDCTNSIERYIVMPAQATSYKVGMRKILELREAAKKRLGAKFDIRDYHDTVLGSGALPLSFLEDNVNGWAARKLKI